MTYTKAFELSMILVVVATVSVAVIFAIISESKTNMNNESQIKTFNYDVDSANLVTRPLWVDTSLSQKIIPSRTCFVINDTNIEKFPLGFKNGLSNFKSRSESLGSSRFETDVGISLTREEALNLISLYHFNLTKTITDRNSKKIPDNQYDFRCFFDYESNQYSIDIQFSTYYPDQVGFTNVNFTTNANGNPTITNPNIVVYSRFNSTIIFNNYLDSDVTLSITGLDAYNVNPTNETVEQKIPSGKSFQFYTKRFGIDSLYTYFIKEFNLNGTILSRIPSNDCISEKETISLFSQFGLKPEFPSYLPKGLDYKCLRYFDPDLSYRFSKNQTEVKSAHGFDMRHSDFYKNGGIEIHYSVFNYVGNGFKNHVVFPINFSSPCGKDSNYCKALKINGKNVTLSNLYFPNDASWDTGKERYMILGNYSLDELVKIVQSMK